MRAPGQAWLQFAAVLESEGTGLLQRVLFVPRGLFGLLYWYTMYPVHLFIFGDMAKAAAQLARTVAVVLPSRRARVSNEPVI